MREWTSSPVSHGFQIKILRLCSKMARETLVCGQFMEISVIPNIEIHKELTDTSLNYPNFKPYFPILIGKYGFFDVYLKNPWSLLSSLSLFISWSSRCILGGFLRIILFMIGRVLAGRIFFMIGALKLFEPYEGRYQNHSKKIHWFTFLFGGCIRKFLVFFLSSFFGNGQFIFS